MKQNFPALFNVNLARRHRAGGFWRAALMGSTLLGLAALVTLVLNILNSSMGYVILRPEVPPASLTVDGMALKDQSSEQLTALLGSRLSSGAFNKLENEQSFTRRSRGNLYRLVLDRIVRYEVVD